MKHWHVTYKDSTGHIGYGHVPGATEAQARAAFAVNFPRCTLVSIRLA